MLEKVATLIGIIPYYLGELLYQVKTGMMLKLTKSKDVNNALQRLEEIKKAQQEEQE